MLKLETLLKEDTEAPAADNADASGEPVVQYATRLAAALSDEGEKVEEDIVLCKAYGERTGMCRTGCEDLNVATGMPCPFLTDTAAQKCPCYQK